MTTPNLQEPSYIGHAARELAALGHPIFPCEPYGKRPIGRLVPNGFKDATRNITTVLEWWVLEPEANIGLPTGRTGVVVLDIDPGHGGDDVLRELERDAGKLPQTFTVATGGGGRHLYYRRPNGGLRNSAGQLGPGVDIRGDDGYVLSSPSRTKGPYKLLNELPVADFPGWLYELLRDPKPAVQGSTGPVDLQPIGSPIYPGTRNSTLASIAGSLRARGHNREEIEAYLHQTNAARCRPHLPLREVSRIAESISRYPAGKATPAPTPAALAALDRIEEAVLSAKWPGIGSATDRAVVIALVTLCRSYGVLIPSGVRVSISHRELALLAGASQPTTTRALLRLARAGWLLKDNANRKRGDAGAVVLRTSNIPQGFITQPLPKYVGLCDEDLRDALPTLRHGGGRLGKRAGEVVEALIRTGGAATVSELATATNIRRDNLRTRYVPKLVDAEIIALDGETVSLTEDWHDKLEVARELGGEINSERANRRRYERDREEFREWIERSKNGKNTRR